MSNRARHARELFAPLGPSYDRVGAVALARPGPALAQLPRLAPAPRRRSRPRRRDRHGPRRAGARSARLPCHRLDQSPEMLAIARAPASAAASSSSRPRPRRFPSTTAPSTTSPSRTSCATSTTRPRRCASWHGSCALEGPSRRSSSACRAGSARPLWELYVARRPPPRGPRAPARLGRGRRFLGGSIRDFWERYPLERQLGLWRAAGCATSRCGGLSLGGGVVIWGTRSVSAARPAFYALERGGWRDYVTLLHPPYTAWHLSYVVIGGCLAPVVAWGRLGAAVARVRARPRYRRARARRAPRPAARTRRSPTPSSSRLPPSRSAAACAIGIVGRRSTFEPWLAACSSPLGRLPRPRLQPRAAGGRFHNGSLVRARLGRLPVVCGYAAVAGELARRGASRRRLRRPPLACPARALEPCALRPPARRGRTGELVLHDGAREELDEARLIASAETGLRLLTAAIVAARSCSRRVPSLASLEMPVIAWILVAALAAALLVVALLRAGVFVARRRAPRARTSSSPRPAERCAPRRRRRRQPRRNSSRVAISRAHADSLSRTRRRSGALGRAARRARRARARAVGRGWPRRSRPSSGESRSACARGRPTSSAHNARSRRRCRALEQHQRQRIADVEARIEAEAAELGTTVDQQRAAALRLRDELESTPRDAPRAGARRAPAPGRRPPPGDRGHHRAAAPARARRRASRSTARRATRGRGSRARSPSSSDDRSSSSSERPAREVDRLSEAGALEFENRMRAIREEAADRLREELDRTAETFLRRADLLIADQLQQAADAAAAAPRRPDHRARAPLRGRAVVCRRLRARATGQTIAGKGTSL